MQKRQLLAALVGLATAAACVRLGFWQLDRLRARRIENDIKVARLVAPPVSPFRLIAGSRRYRRVTVTGTFDFDHQIVLTGRSHDGAPGVYIITPFAPDVPPGRQAAALLVNRGWVYSADAQTVELANFDETPHQTITGWVQEFDLGGEGPARAASTPYAWRRMDARETPRAFPYPVAPFYVIAQPDSGATSAAGAPVRLPLPAIDEGPHKSYAIQWFAFALIALVGAGAVIRRDRRTASHGNP